MANLIDGISNSDLGSGIGGIVGGIGSLFSGFGQADVLDQQAQSYQIAAQYATENADLAGEAGGLQEAATARQIQHVQGSQEAATAANGLKMAGSAMDIIKDSTRQGALAEGQIGLQTAINTVSFEAQAAADQGAAQAAKAAASNAETGGIFGALGGALKAVPLIAGLF